jgi:adenosylcobinamide kinase/adenosylcobinamide-phosphate guanylyltransferase
MPRRILITGGARSGKSYYAQELAMNLSQPVLFVATAEAGDEEMRQRIEAHRNARPGTWRTLEAATDVGSRIRQEISDAQTVILDCITLLINNVFSRNGGSAGETMAVARIEQEVLAEIAGLLECVHQVEASFIIVSNEVGLGLVPANRVSRLYRDLLGKANQMLARSLDEVCLMVAGIPLPIKPSFRDD